MTILGFIVFAVCALDLAAAAPRDCEEYAQGGHGTVTDHTFKSVNSRLPICGFPQHQTDSHVLDPAIRVTVPSLAIGKFPVNVVIFDSPTPESASTLPGTGRRGGGRGGGGGTSAGSMNSIDFNGLACLLICMALILQHF